MEKISDEAGLARMADTLQKDAEKVLTREADYWGEASGEAAAATALFFAVFNLNPKKPAWAGRDRFFLVDMGIHPVWYAAMARAGFFAVEELATAGSGGGRLVSHPPRQKIKGLEWSPGGGLGLAGAAGVALWSQIREEKWRTYAYIGQQETTGGDLWEAAGWAAKQKAHRLTGLAAEISPDSGHGSLKERFESFGWHTISVKRQAISQIKDACEEAKLNRDKPSMVLLT